MKKINSNSASGMILFVIVVFTIVIPSIFYCVKLLGFTVLGSWIIKASLAMGLLISLSSCLILIIEFRQDRRMNKYYEEHKNTKLPLQNQLYECQNCGNREIKSEDTSCKICGIAFKVYSDKPPYHNY